jgi:hypothetical protein
MLLTSLRRCELERFLIGYGNVAKLNDDAEDSETEIMVRLDGFIGFVPALR